MCIEDFGHFFDWMFMRGFDQSTSSKRPRYDLRVEERQARDYCE